MSSTFAVGEFQRKKSIIPSGMGEDGSDPSLNALRKLEASFFDLAFCNMTWHIVMRNPYENGSIFTFNDSKLLNERRLSFNRRGNRSRIK
jgi:hypothetical protein